MKKAALLLPLLLVSFAMPVYAAQKLESVRVIKFWTSTNDMIVEREGGQKLLLQHNRVCNSMSTEFPIQILWNGEKIKEVKVAANELCKVYNFGPYTSDLTILKRIASGNALATDHLAEVKWDGSTYQIDYEKGCKYINDFVGSTAYIYKPGTDLDGSTLYLPQNRGQCLIKSATLLKKGEEVQTEVQDFPLKNLNYLPENNQIFFSWDAFPEKENWLTLVSYSKYKLNPSELTLSQMPNQTRSRINSLTVKQLVNDQAYYVYITAKKGNEDYVPWKEMVITPKKTAKVLINNPGTEAFQVTMTETESGYHFTWPDKSTITKRYLVTLYVDGKQASFEFLPAAQNTYELERKPEWTKNKFRFTVKSIPLKPTGLKHSDGIFWESKKK